MRSSAGAFVHCADHAQGTKLLTDPFDGSGGLTRRTSALTW
jgi:hypothetical protein